MCDDITTKLDVTLPTVARDAAKHIAGFVCFCFLVLTQIAKHKCVETKPAQQTTQLVSACEWIGCALCQETTNYEDQETKASEWLPSARFLPIIVNEMHDGDKICIHSYCKART